MISITSIDPQRFADALIWSPMCSMKQGNARLVNVCPKEWEGRTSGRLFRVRLESSAGLVGEGLTSSVRHWYPWVQLYGWSERELMVRGRGEWAVYAPLYIRQTGKPQLASHDDISTLANCILLMTSVVSQYANKQWGLRINGVGCENRIHFAWRRCSKFYLIIDCGIVQNKLDFRYVPVNFVRAGYPAGLTISIDQPSATRTSRTRDEGMRTG